jgi:hypothetical protein
MAKSVPEDQVDNFLRNCITAQFLIDDLRVVSDYVGCSTVEEMENYYWFKQHFNGGFTAPKSIASGRNGNNESESNLGFNIRSVVQDKGLGIGQSSSAWGVDLYSLRAVNVIKTRQDVCFNKAHFARESKYPLRCEHVDELADLRNVIRDKVMLTNSFGSLQSTAEFLGINHLAAVITVSEDKTSKTQSKTEDHSSRQPFRRYVKAGSVIFMDTGLEGPDSSVNVTHSTKEDVTAIRLNNPRWKTLLEGIRTHVGFDSQYLQERRKEFHESKAGKKSERSSSFYPELTDRNLKIIERNDPVELCREFYTWKIK